VMNVISADALPHLYPRCDLRQTVETQIFFHAFDALEVFFFLCPSFPGRLVSTRHFLIGALLLFSFGIIPSRDPPPFFSTREGGSGTLPFFPLVFFSHTSKNRHACGSIGFVSSSEFLPLNRIPHSFIARISQSFPTSLSL